MIMMIGSAWAVKEVDPENEPMMPNEKELNEPKPN
jgi:hypothetical protein